MVGFYLISGIAVCVLFVYTVMIGGEILNFGSPAEARPKGPGQHFHK